MLSVHRREKRAERCFAGNKSPKAVFVEYPDLTTYEMTSEVQGGPINLTREDPWRDVASSSIIMRLTLEKRTHERVRCVFFCPLHTFRMLVYAIY